MVPAPSLHDAVGRRLAALDQRYTPARRVLVDALDRGGRPLTIPEILRSAPHLAQSSAYRNLTALIEAGVVQRVAGTDDHGRFELAEELAGHHHHLVCQTCGRVEDIRSSADLEQALADAAGAVAAQAGYQVSEHRLDLFGLCPACRS